MGEKRHTEESIVTILRSHFNRGYTYRLNNVFIYGENWESDFFCIDDDGYAYEFEVKISRSDFKYDFKKYKHYLFKKPNKSGFLMPNKFYYVVPDGMVVAEDIPNYAGLIYIVGNHLEIIRKAPLIHTTKRDYRRRIASKVYERYATQRRQLALVRIENEELKKLIRNISKHLPKAQQHIVASNYWMMEVKFPPTRPI